jgi:hypothetical protein
MSAFLVEQISVFREYPLGQAQRVLDSIQDCVFFMEMMLELMVTPLFLKHASGAVSG